MLNHYDLGLYVESWLKSFMVSRLPGLWELKYRNLIASVIVFVHLRSYDLVGSVTCITQKYKSNKLAPTVDHEHQNEDDEHAPGEN